MRAPAAVSAGDQAPRGAHVLMCVCTPWEGGPRQGEQAWAWGAGAATGGLSGPGRPGGSLQAPGAFPLGDTGQVEGSGQEGQGCQAASCLLRLLPGISLHPAPCSSMNPRRHGRGVPHSPHCAQVPAGVMGKDPGLSTRLGLGRLMSWECESTCGLAPGFLCRGVQREQPEGPTSPPAVRPRHLPCPLTPLSPVGG